jgi:hypothetical protein
LQDPNQLTPDQVLSIIHLAGTGARPNLRDLMLSGLDLSGINFRHSDLSGANLSGANLSGANLSGADLSRAYLSGADLSGANLSGANLSRANLIGIVFLRTDLTSANLSGANLSRANLYGTNLSEADLTKANLSEADLSNAQLNGANFKGVIANDLTINHEALGSYVRNLEEKKHQNITENPIVKLLFPSQNSWNESKTLPGTAVSTATASRFSTNETARGAPSTNFVIARSKNNQGGKVYDLLSRESLRDNTHQYDKFYSYDGITEGVRR